MWLIDHKTPSFSLIICIYNYIIKYLITYMVDQDLSQTSSVLTIEGYLNK